MKQASSLPPHRPVARASSVVSFPEISRYGNAEILLWRREGIGMLMQNGVMRALTVPDEDYDEDQLVKMIQPHVYARGRQRA